MAGEALNVWEEEMECEKVETENMSNYLRKPSTLLLGSKEHVHTVDAQ